MRGEFEAALKILKPKGHRNAARYDFAVKRSLFFLAQSVTFSFVLFRTLE